jgi:hypothetical protein
MNTNDKPNEKSNAITRFLLEYEFPTKLNGYKYIKECLETVMTNTIPPSNKIMYAELAEKFNTDDDNIERCLQTLVNQMWRVLSHVGLFTKRPTIREFVMKCAEFISLNTARPRSAYDILFVPDSHFRQD